MINAIRSHLAEFGIVAPRCHRRKVGQARLDLRIGKACVELSIELFDDCGRCAPGRANPEPGARLVARLGSRPRSGVREAPPIVPLSSGPARAACRPYMPDRVNRRGEHDLDLPTEQIGQCRRYGAIRYVHHVDAGHYLEQLAGHGGPASVAERCKIEGVFIRRRGSS